MIIESDERACNPRIAGRNRTEEEFLVLEFMFFRNLIFGCGFETGKDALFIDSEPATNGASGTSTVMMSLGTEPNSRLARPTE